MYVIAFNINQKSNNDVRALTQYPTILVNNSITLIIQEIRKIIDKNFEMLSNTYSIPISDFSIGLSSYYRDENNDVKMHSFDIDIKNIKEVKEIIKRINSQ